MAEEIVAQFGYLGLVAVSFVAATLVPVSSEVVVVVMAALGYNGWLLLVCATIGNYLGAVTNYYVGKYGGTFVLARLIRLKPAALEKTRAIYSKWGTPVLVLSWVPVVGDPLTVVAGVVEVHIGVFSCWVIMGKMLRYAAILGFARTLFSA